MIAQQLPEGLEPGGRFDTWAAPRVDAVLSDADGTLLSEHHVPTRTVQDAIIGATAAGVGFGFATGRSAFVAGPLIEAVRTSIPSVFDNGSTIWHDGEVLEQKGFDDEHLSSLLDVVGDHTYLELIGTDHYAALNLTEQARVHWDLLGRIPRSIDDGAPVPAPLIRAIVIAFGEAGQGFPDHEPLAATLRDAGFKTGAAHAHVAPDVTFINITRPDIDKGVGVRRVAERTGHDMANLLTIGDGDNDVPMLDIAGTAVAMGQASDAVKARAHLVAPTVHEDGLAHVLRWVTTNRAPSAA